jgi:hypothetical protein
MLVAVAVAFAPVPAARAEPGDGESLERDMRFDWEIREEPSGAVVTWLRGGRDGVLTIADSAADLQIGLFAEVALDLSTVLMAASDVLGLIDDNPISEHVLGGVASKSLARTAYLLHGAGADAILGSHGLEREWYLEGELDSLNPLLTGDPVGPTLPLEPLAFLGEAMLHEDVYTARVPGVMLAATVAADVGLRPAAGLARIAGLGSVADALDARSRGLIKAAVP